MESMDFLDSDSNGICLTTSMEDDVSSSYAALYLESFLPVYQMVNQSALTGVADLYRAIKPTADALLSLTASGASWSDALKKKLVKVLEGNTSGNCASNVDEFRSRTSKAMSTSSISCRQQLPDNDINNLCKPIGSHETANNLARKLSGVRSPDQLRKGLVGRRKSVAHRFAEREARRNQNRH